ncbi:hypothetical protein FRB91_000298 [Serendipita sp. 411]|nr:hypothetical protein FRB91_000298 [Serendipita sp. 411]
MAASSRSDSPTAATARAPSPIDRTVPSDEAIEHIIQQATASAMASGRPPIIGRDTRTQLFVGNLPYRVRWQDLKDLFRKAGGTVLRADVSLGPDNRSRGYGTVLLASAEDAGRAIDMFNGYVWQTRTLEVRLDRLPNDFDTATGQLAKLPVVPPSQLVQYPTMSASSASAYPYSMMGLPSSKTPTPASSQLSPPTRLSALGQSSLSMSTGLNRATSPDPMTVFSSETVRQSILGETSRSSNALKMTSASANQSSGNSFDIVSGVSTTSSMSQASGSGSHPSSSPDLARTVHIYNWSSQFGLREFERFFHSVGTVIKAEVTHSNDLDGSANGTIVYSSVEEAQSALAKFNGTEVGGRILRLRIGQNEPLSLSQQSAGLSKRRPSDETVTSTNAPSTMATSTAPSADASAYSYPSYIAMPPPTMTSGYLVTSNPGSPYDTYPPSVTYVPVATSPTAPYPPPVAGTMYTYPTWHHPPSPTVATNNVLPQASSNKGTSIVAIGQTATNSSSAYNPTAGSGSLRSAPGTITLPAPGIAGYPPPQVSPMHGLPPITPSMPSFTFVGQPLPTPPHFGVGPYSPVSQGPPSYYRHNPYFTLSPGPSVPYHHDVNAAATNGVIGSGVGGPGMMGQISPYYDMTAATAGSDAPQEYFPPMPVTSLTGVMQTLQLASAPTASTIPGTGEYGIGASTGSNAGAGPQEEEPAPYLEPVGVGRDGFPTLLVGATGGSPDGPREGVSRNGPTEWVTTPDDLPNNGSIKYTATTTLPSTTTITTRARERMQIPERKGTASVPAERNVPADPTMSSSSNDSRSNTSSVAATAGSASPGSVSPGGGRGGSSSSSSKKPKLNLGQIPRFSPPTRFVSAYSSMTGASTQKSSSGASVAAIAAANKSPNTGPEQFGQPQGHRVASGNGNGTAGRSSPGSGGTNASADTTNVSAVTITTTTTTTGAATSGTNAHALKVNGGMRRASWTEDASRRQSIVNHLQAVNVGDGR